MENIVLVTLCRNDTFIHSEIFKLIAYSGCYITEGRSVVLGQEIVATLFLSGAWSALAKFEAGLPLLEKKFELKILIKRTQAAVPASTFLPYSSHIVAPDHPDVAYKIIEFLSDHHTFLYDFQVSAYKAPTTEALMLSISLTFGLPSNKIIADFRENFIVFCDENNFDVAMEPQER